MDDLGEVSNVEAKSLQLSSAEKAELDDFWARVFKVSNKVIYDAGLYGFYGMEIIPDPNIHTMMQKLNLVDTLLDNVLVHFGARESVDTYTETRLVLNAKQQILNLERVVAALKANCKEDFDNAINTLRSQAVF